MYVRADAVRLCEEPKYQKYIEGISQWSLDMNLSSSVRNSTLRLLFLSNVPFDEWITAKLNGLPN